MLSYCAQIKGKLPVAFFKVQTSDVNWGYLEPVTDPPVLVGHEPFTDKDVGVLHVPDKATLKVLMKSVAVIWAVGSTEAHQKAALGQFKWPDNPKDPLEPTVERAVPVIVGGAAPTLSVSP